MWRLNNLYKIRTKNKGIVPFRFNTHQQQIAEEISHQNPIRHFTLKARQVGLSTFWLLWHLDDTMFKHGVVTGILAHKLESIQHLSSIVKIAIENFPGRPIKLIEDSRTRITFPDTNSTIIFSLEIRSSPLHNLHISEWCFCENERVWATIGATSKWTNITGETTGNGIGNDGYLTYMDAIEKKNEYITKFVPWFDHEEYRLPLNGQSHLLPDKRESSFKLDQEQIHFRRQMMARLKNAFFIEYPETPEDAFAQSGANFFDNKKIVILAKEARDYNETEKIVEEQSLYRMWEKPHSNHTYAAGVDVAEGIEGDYSVLKILCVTCRQEAFMYRGHVGLDQFYRDIDHWCRRYNNCLLAVERNNHGHAIILGLRENCRYSNLYIENEDDTRIVRKFHKSEKSPKYGWSTNLNTKTMMLDQLKMAMEGNSEEDETTFQPEITIRDLNLLSECLTFQKNGVKLNAIAGKHDDIIMSTAIAFQMYLKLRNKITFSQVTQVLVGGEREQKL